METHTTGKYGHNFRVSGHLGREENDRNEHEQRAEHVDKVRYEVHIIIKDYSSQRGFLGHKVIDLLTDIKNDDNADDENQRHKESSHELLDDI